MNDLKGEEFIELRCCGKSLGYVNARPFTPEADARVAPADGTPIRYPCERCGAKFAWTGGQPVQISVP